MKYFVVVGSVLFIFLSVSVAARIGELRIGLDAANNAYEECVASGASKACVDEEALVDERRDQIGVGRVLFWAFGLSGLLANVFSMGLILEEDVFEGLDLMRNTNPFRTWLCLFWPIGLVVAAYIAVDRCLTGALK